MKNTAVSNKTGFNDLPLITADHHNALFSHICRLSPERPVHRALQLCTDTSSDILPAPDWRYPPGRPRRMWLKQVEKHLVQLVSSAQITAMHSSELEFKHTSTSYGSQILLLPSADVFRQSLGNVAVSPTFLMYTVMSLMHDWLL